jgi:hypothetical protein
MQKVMISPQDREKWDALNWEWLTVTEGPHAVQGGREQGDRQGHPGDAAYAYTPTGGSKSLEQLNSDPAFMGAQARPDEYHEYQDKETKEVKRDLLWPTGVVSLFFSDGSSTSTVGNVEVLSS